VQGDKGKERERIGEPQNGVCVVTRGKKKGLLKFLGGWKVGGGELKVLREDGGGHWGWGTQFCART